MFAHWAIQMYKSSQIFSQTSPHISTNIDYNTKLIFLEYKLTQYLNESCQNCNIKCIYFLFFLNNFENPTLFCISISIMKLLNPKTQNNFCSSQIIEQGIQKVTMYNVVQNEKRFSYALNIANFKRLAWTFCWALTSDLWRVVTEWQSNRLIVGYGL